MYLQLSRHFMVSGLVFVWCPCVLSDHVPQIQVLIRNIRNGTALGSGRRTLGWHQLVRIGLGSGGGGGGGGLGLGLGLAGLCCCGG